MSEEMTQRTQILKIAELYFSLVFDAGCVGEETASRGGIC